MRRRHLRRLKLYLRYCLTAPQLFLTVVTWGLMGGLSTGLAGCHSDTTVTQPTAEQSPYWTFSLNVHAVLLSIRAPYNTIQLVTTPRDATGKTVTNVAPPRFFASADSNVRVSATGLVTARGVTNEFPSTIVVKQTVGNVTLTDSVRVQISDVASPPRLTTFTMTQKQVYQDGISDKLAIGRDIVFAFHAIDANGNSIPGLPIALESSDPTIAYIYYPQDSTQTTVRSRRVGHVTLIATTNAYGVSKQAKLDIQIVPPKDVFVTALERTPIESRTPIVYFAPSLLTVSEGATILFSTSLSHSVDVVFDDPTAASAVPSTTDRFFLCLFDEHLDCNAGNIPARQIPPGVKLQNGFAIRYFPRAGRYRFHSRLFPSDTGTLEVVRP